VLLRHYPLFLYNQSRETEPLILLKLQGVV